MGELINGRTPEEIKAALQWLVYGCPESEPECEDCIHSQICSSATEADAPRHALALIERLESECDAALAKVPRWISVEERLPEDDVDVLVCGVGRGNGCKVVAMTRYTHHMYGYNIEGWRSPWDYFHCEYEITHWMPLPEPPEEEEK